MKIIPLVSALAIFAASLAPVAASAAKPGVVKEALLEGIEPGMTKDEIIGKLGPAGDRSFSGDVEALQYCKQQGLFADYDEYTTIFLRGGRVVALSKTRKFMFSSSCRTYPAVDWTATPR